MGLSWSVLMFSSLSFSATTAEIVNFFPNKYWEAANAYLDIAVSGDPSLSVNRRLIDKSKEAVVGDPCFLMRSLDFYEGINQEDIAFKKKLETMANKESLSGPLGARPSLMRPHKNLDEDFSPGWLWERALKASEGNANVAIKMIGLCGHDDVAQSFFLKSSDLEFEQAQHNSEVETDIAQDKLLVGLRTLFREKAEIKFPCPDQDSKFYLPRSLGDTVDISDSMKTEIGRLQAPKQGLGVIPAKVYHIYGAARIACEMRERGLGKEETSFVVSKMPLIYRNMKICQKVDSLEGFDNFLGAKDFLAGRKVHKGDLRGKIKLNLKKCMPKVVPKGGYWWTSLPNPCREFIDRLLHTGHRKLIREGLRSEEDLDKATEAVASQIEASRLYRLWYLGSQKIGGKQIPCSGVRLGGPSSLEATEKSNCGSGWNTKECNEAKRILNTWQIDMDWTEAQHALGAKFAMENCKPKSKTSTLSKVSCPDKTFDGQKCN